MTCILPMQMPVFLSVFVGIRQMANYPVLSMKTGGILWFTDLTLTDPFYLLPLFTMSTLFLTIEVRPIHTAHHNSKDALLVVFVQTF